MSEIQFGSSRASAVLIATSKYRSAAIPNLPAAANNLQGLRGALTDPALGLIHRNQCSTVVDPDRSSQVSRAIRQSGESRTLLFYYAGHGFLDRRGDLYLGLTEMEPDDIAASALPYDVLREAILDSPASQKIVILDCCFSGRAITGAMSTPESQFLDYTQVEGTYVLASTSRNKVSFAPEGERYTAFTDELINILIHGIPSAPEFLSLSSIYSELRKRLTARGYPSPQHSSSNTSGEIYLARNAAVPISSAAELTSSATGNSRDSEFPSADPRLTVPRWIDPGFAHEATRGRDMLGIRKDAVALAVLLSSRSMSPPLALAVYGNWGSGKTFFMKTLDREIQLLTDQGSPDSCGKVASVWFNAWQYAEGNLWASLTHHIFLSLHHDGPAPERELNDALTTVQGVCDAKADAAANLRRSEEAVKRARVEVAELQSKAEEARAGAAKVRGRDLLDAISVDEQLRESLNDVAKELRLPEAGISAREVVQSAGEVRATVENGRALSVTGRWWKTPIALGIAVAVVAGGISVAISTLLHARHGALSPIVAEAGQFLALAAGIAAWITRQSSLARSLMRPAERIQQQVSARIAEQESRYRAESAIAIENLNRTEAELIRARHEQADAQDREAAARLDLDRLSGTRLLKRYLSDRATSSEYGQYLGAVALAHRDLRDLESYLQTAATDKKGGPIDRIVLYIDDLDRCQPGTVVQVLESVNLLLSLPLFVVVVGVDIRWLMQSLHDVHPLLLKRLPADSQATPIDYLDKIFQLAYQLPNMSADACAELLEYTAINTQPKRQLPAADDGNTSSGRNADRSSASSTEVDESSHDVDLSDSQVEAVGSIALELSTEELKTLRMVAQLVGSSPRRAKRFLNIYRIIKARALMDPTTYQLLTDKVGKSNAAVGLLVVTALAVGFPSYIPSAMASAEQSTEHNLRSWLEQQLQLIPPRQADLLKSFLSNNELPELPMKNMLQWLPIMRRFAWSTQPTFDPNPSKKVSGQEVASGPSEEGKKEDLSNLGC